MISPAAAHVKTFYFLLTWLYKTFVTCLKSVSTDLIWFRPFFCTQLPGTLKRQFSLNDCIITTHVLKLSSAGLFQIIFWDLLTGFGLGPSSGFHRSRRRDTTRPASFVQIQPFYLKLNWNLRRWKQSGWSFGIYKNFYSIKQTNRLHEQPNQTKIEYMEDQIILIALIFTWKKRIVL